MSEVMHFHCFACGRDTNTNGQVPAHCPSCGAKPPEFFVQVGMNKEPLTKVLGVTNEDLKPTRQSSTPRNKTTKI